MFDFSDPQAVQAWRALDDRVMGGVSRSALIQDPAGHAVFQGTVSLANNGGFASVRSTPADRGLAGARQCLVEMSGEPRVYTLGLLMEDGLNSAHYQATFVSDLVWQTVALPIAGFRATFRGRSLPDAPPLDPARIRQVGLLISNRQAGPFALRLRHISLVA